MIPNVVKTKYVDMENVQINVKNLIQLKNVKLILNVSLIEIIKSVVKNDALVLRKKKTKPPSAQVISNVKETQLTTCVA